MGDEVRFEIERSRLPSTQVVEYHPTAWGVLVRVSDRCSLDEILSGMTVMGTAIMNAHWMRAGHQGPYTLTIARSDLTPGRVPVHRESVGPSIRILVRRDLDLDTALAHLAEIISPPTQSGWVLLQQPDQATG